MEHKSSKELIGELRKKSVLMMSDEAWDILTQLFEIMDKVKPETTYKELPPDKLMAFETFVDFTAAARIIADATYPDRDRVDRALSVLFFSVGYAYGIEHGQALWEVKGGENKTV